MTSDKQTFSLGARAESSEYWWQNLNGLLSDIIPRPTFTGFLRESGTDPVTNELDNSTKISSITWTVEDFNKYFYLGDRMEIGYNAVQIDDNGRDYFDLGCRYVKENGETYINWETYRIFHQTYGGLVYAPIWDTEQGEAAKLTGIFFRGVDNNKNTTNLDRLKIESLYFRRALFRGRMITCV